MRVALDLVLARFTGKVIDNFQEIILLLEKHGTKGLFLGEFAEFVTAAIILEVVVITERVAEKMRRNGW